MDEPFPDWVGGVLAVALGGPFIAALVIAFWNGGRKGALMRLLKGDPGYTLVLDNAEQVAFRAREGRPVTVRERIFVRQTNKGTSTTREWHIEVGGLEHLAGRSSIFIGLDGLTGTLRNRDGFTDVKVGDRAFDRQFKVGGSDADVVRGVFADDAVREAVRAVFSAMTVMRCTLEGGTLVVEFPPNHVRASTARRRIALVRRLADALDAAGGSLALPHPAEARGSAAAQSGSPVGVRIV